MGVWKREFSARINDGRSSAPEDGHEHERLGECPKKKKKKAIESVLSLYDIVLEFGWDFCLGLPVSITLHSGGVWTNKLISEIFGLLTWTVGR